jgi:hypothetical protein
MEIAGGRSVLVNTGVTGTRAADGIVVAIRHLPGTHAETPKLGQPRPQQTTRTLTVDQPAPSRQVTARATPPHRTTRQPLPSADYALVSLWIPGS